MRELYQKNKQAIYKMLVLLLLTAGIYLFFRYLFSYVAPFIFAWIFSSSMEPMIRWFHKRWKLSRGVSSILSIFIMLLFIGTVVTGIIMKVTQQMQALAREFPIYYEGFINTLDNLRIRTESFIFGLPLQIQNLLRGGLDELIKGFPNLLGPGVGKGSIDFVVAVPNALFVTIVTIIATFFISKDKEKIRSFLERQMPKSWVRKMDIIRRDLFGALLGYIKAQLILMLFTSSICMVGLSILRMKYSLLIGIAIGIFDAFPILGSGGVLIPWAIYNGITGNLYNAIGLLIIYGTVVLFRQTLEPKVLSSQIGVYPLVTLMAMYIGVKLFGVLGLIIGPVFIIFLKTMQKIGIIPQWK